MATSRRSLCDDGVPRVVLRRFHIRIRTFPPVLRAVPPVTEPRSSPVPPQPPLNGQGRSLSPDLSRIQRSHVSTRTVSRGRRLRACRESAPSGPLPRVTFDNFVDFVAGVGDVLLGTVSLGITDGAEYRRVMDIGSVDLDSKLIRQASGARSLLRQVSRGLRKADAAPTPIRRACR